MDEQPNRGAQRRAHILQAAIDVLASAGLHGLTMHAVATRAELAKSVVLYHVRDRAGLLRLVTEEVALQRSAVDAPLYAMDGDPRQHLTHWLGGLFDMAQRADSPIRLAWLLQLDTELPLATLIGQSQDKHTVHRLAQLLARGHAQSCWHAADAVRVATAVKALTDGYLLQVLAAREDGALCQRLRATCRGTVMDLLVR